MIVLFELSNIQLKEKIMSIENKENLKKIYNRSLEDFLDELMDMELITTEECSDYFYPLQFRYLMSEHIQL